MLGSQDKDPACDLTLGAVVRKILPHLTIVGVEGSLVFSAIRAGGADGELSLMVSLLFESILCSDEKLVR